MLVALLALPLLVGTARAHGSKGKFEYTERMGLDVPLTRTLQFYIPDNLCSGVVSTPMYDDDCQEPLAMEVSAQDSHVPQVTLDPRLQVATVVRKRNAAKDCPGEATVLVRVACPSHNGTRRFGGSFVPKPRVLPVAKYEDLVSYRRIRNL